MSPTAKIVLVLLVALTCARCEGTDVQTTAYASLTEARSEGAVADGSIPALVPPGAVDIREAHAPDRSRRWGIFSFPPSEAHLLRAALADEEISVAGADAGMPGRVEWWPLLLRGKLDPEGLKAAGLQAHRVKNERLIVVVNWKQGRAYYWSD